jgi:hypothetical protein
LKKLDQSRPLPLKISFVILAVASIGCVNRGMHAPGGEVGVGGGGGAGGAAGMGGHGVGGSPDGGIDSTGDGEVDAIDTCDVDGGVDGGDGGVADAGSVGPCTAMFNFESPAGCGLYTAYLNSNPDNPPATAGFSNLVHTGNAYCGHGAMAVDVNFDGPPGNMRTGGEIVIPISRTGVDYTGKTLSIAIKGSVAGGSLMRFSVIPITTARYEQTAISVPVTTDWMVASAVLPTPDASASSVTGISLQAHGASPYVGTIYIDEIDVRNTPPDGGADAFDARADADAAPVDARDAPSGN